MYGFIWHIRKQLLKQTHGAVFRKRKYLLEAKNPIEVIGTWKGYRLYKNYIPKNWIDNSQASIDRYTRCQTFPCYEN